MFCGDLRRAWEEPNMRVSLKSLGSSREMFGNRNNRRYSSTTVSTSSQSAANISQFPSGRYSPSEQHQHLYPSAPPIHYAYTTDRNSPLHNNHQAAASIGGHLKETPVMAKTHLFIPPRTTPITGSSRSSSNGSSTNHQHEFVGPPSPRVPPKHLQDLLISSGIDSAQTMRLMSQLQPRDLMDVDENAKSYFDQEYICIGGFLRRIFVVVMALMLYVLIQNSIQVVRIVKTDGGRALFKTQINTILDESDDVIAAHYMNQNQRSGTRSKHKYSAEVALAFITISMLFALICTCMLAYLFRLDARHRYNQRIIDKYGKISGYLIALIIPINIIISALTYFALPKM